MSSIPVRKVEPSLQPPCRSSFWPTPDRQGLLQQAHVRFSISPTHRQQAHDTASHRHTLRKGHDSRGPPDSGNSHVFSRPSSHSFSTVLRISFSRRKSSHFPATEEANTGSALMFSLRHKICLVTPRIIQWMCDSFRVLGAHARESSKCQHNLPVRSPHGLLLLVACGRSLAVIYPSC